MLASRLLASFFGSESPPASVAVGLALNGDEVRDVGYKRQVVRRGSWRVRDAIATAKVSFGPFDAARQFDQVVVFEGQEVLDVADLQGVVTVVPGMVFDAEPVLEIG